MSVEASLEPCTVVLDDECQAPPAVVGITGTRGRCFTCGGAVCPSCSVSVRCDDVKRHRVCANCLEQSSPEGAARVLLLRYHHAGYGYVTLASCVEQLGAVPCGTPATEEDLPPGAHLFTNDAFTGASTAAIRPRGTEDA
jgi:hypothetical protein